MPLTGSRYDGHAEWYDGWNRPNAERNAADVRDLLGPGGGLCLDLGCGSGLYFDVLTATGRTVVGLDRSGCAIIRWLTCSTRSSPRGWSSSTSPSQAIGQSRSSSPSGPISQR
jgi:hypothetical protein